MAAPVSPLPIDAAARQPPSARAGRAGGRLPEIAAAPLPDPAAGVFETLLVRGGAARNVAAHVARMRASGAALELRVPERLEELIAQQARRLGTRALRLTLTAAGLTIDDRALPPRGLVELVPIVVPGGLGAHKWADRRLIDAYSGPGVAPLICDVDGHVLEAGHAAVMVVRAGRLIAPPVDGRQVPPTSRPSPLEEQPIRLDDLRRADAIILSSSLRGAHPAVLRASPPPSARAPRAPKLHRQVPSVEAGDGQAPSVEARDGRTSGEPGSARGAATASATSPPGTA
jgi:para-aminobenzoate synthetase/4-amino-4-deoxychorismate lyase